MLGTSYFASAPFGSYAYPIQHVSVTLTETQVTADATMRTLHAVRDPAEPLSTVDATMRMSTATRSSAESLSTSAAVVAAHGYPRPLSEALTTNTLTPMVIVVANASLSEFLVTRETMIAAPHITIRTLSDSLITGEISVIGLLLPRSLSETLTVSDQVARGFVYRRLTMREGVAITERLTAHVTSARDIVEAIPTHEVLLFTGSARRTLSDHLTIADHATFARTYHRINAQTVTGRDALTRRANLHRLLIEATSQSELVHRGFFSHRHLIDTIPASSAVQRAVSMARRASEHTSVADSLRQTNSLQLAFVLNLTTLDGLTHLASHARTLHEILTTSDSLPHLQLDLSVMGYIYNDAGSIIATLPDWTFVLIENEIGGNVLTTAPVTPRAILPMREK